MTQKNNAHAFRAMHQPGAPFIIANPWDAGSARMLEGLGFAALATSSSGFALTQGRSDYGVSREAALAHCGDVVRAVTIPVSADLENGWGAAPEDCAETIRLAREAGLAGGSIEDSTGDPDYPIYDLAHAVDRITAAREAAQDVSGGADFLLTARAEAFLWGEPDLADVITRLQHFEAAGADVLFAPGLPDLEAVRAVCSSVSKPVNILIHGTLMNHSVTNFAEAGAARLSVGGALAFAAYGGLIEASSLLETGTFGALRANGEGAARLRDVLIS